MELKWSVRRGLCAANAGGITGHMCECVNLKQRMAVMSRLDHHVLTSPSTECEFREHFHQQLLQVPSLVIAEDPSLKRTATAGGDKVPRVAHGQLDGVSRKQHPHVHHLDVQHS